MKKILVLIGFSLLFVIMDNVFMPFVAIKGCYPSLAFAFCICYSIINGSWEGLWLGVFIGILQDVYFTNAFGVNALANMLMCVMAGTLGVNIFKEKLLLPVTMNFLIALLKGVLVFTVLYAIGQFTSFENIAFIAFYTMIVSIFMYRWVYKLCSKRYMEKKWRF